MAEYVVNPNGPPVRPPFFAPQNQLDQDALNLLQRGLGAVGDAAEFMVTGQGIEQRGHPRFRPYSAPTAPVPNEPQVLPLWNADP